MSIVYILYMLFIRPIELVLELVFVIAERHVTNPGYAIIVLSMVVNFLVLPLYKKADAIQEEEAKKQASMKRWTTHIKKTFRGDERFFMLQTYYRQSCYRPVYALKSAVPLLLQIPFFIAAYRFLSGLSSLSGVSFGPIDDLASPDGLINVGNLDINLLPVLMTLINIISGAVYLKGRSVKDKLQTFILAGVFLVLLYNSPAGLVFYWTLNNIFSLLKNIIDKRLKKKDKKTKVVPEGQQMPGKTGALFSVVMLCLALLTGTVIPSYIMSLSTVEFMDTDLTRSPARYIVSSALLAAGIFLVWGHIFYLLMKPQAKRRAAKVVWVVLVMALVNYLAFSYELGNLSPTLQYNGKQLASAFDLDKVFVNAYTLILAADAALILLKFIKERNVMLLCAAAAAVFMVLSVVRLDKVNRDVTEIMALAGKEDGNFSFNLSKDGKNVVIIMLDRAMESYIPYIFAEKPELKDKYDGFTAYTNTMSYGAYTNFGVPCLFGGYEYTPEEMNKRSTELLKDKHNESLLLMPVLFGEEGYDVTVCDLPYANYKEPSDLSLYDAYPYINAYNTSMNTVNLGLDSDSVDMGRERNFFLYSLYRVSPVLLRKTIYNDGDYNEAKDNGVVNTGNYNVQTLEDAHKGEGIYYNFMKHYLMLDNLDTFTNITEDGCNLLMLNNMVTHEPMLLQKPDYTPQYYVDNTQWDEENKSIYVQNGETLVLADTEQMVHYCGNMAAAIKLAEWFDYLREQGVYDNTRIILCADHGRGLDHIDSMILDSGFDTEWFMPLLMVKDFDAHGFEMDDTFMTQADVPLLAMDGIVQSPVNPFTGKELTDSAKNGENHVLYSYLCVISENDGYTFKPGAWYSVKSPVYDPKSWTFIGEY